MAFEYSIPLSSTGLSLGPRIKGDVLSWPLEKIFRNIERCDRMALFDRPPAVLLTTGAMNPVHRGNVAIMDAAAEALTKEGFTVVGGFLSPSHENFMKERSQTPTALASPKEYPIPAQMRCSLVDLALHDHPLFACGRRESLASMGDTVWPDFDDVCRDLREYLLTVFSPYSPRVFYVCGKDLFLRAKSQIVALTREVSHAPCGAVVVSRLAKQIEEEDRIQDGDLLRVLPIDATPETSGPTRAPHSGYAARTYFAAPYRWVPSIDIFELLHPLVAINVAWEYSCADPSIDRIACLWDAALTHESEEGLKQLTIFINEQGMTPEVPKHCLAGLTTTRAAKPTPTRPDFAKLMEMEDLLGSEALREAFAEHPCAARLFHVSAVEDCLVHYLVDNGAHVTLMGTAKETPLLDADGNVPAQEEVQDLMWTAVPDLDQICL